MKVTPRTMVRAALVLAAAGVIGAFGACKDSGGITQPPPPPPPPPPPIAAPSGLAATAVSGTQIDLTWTDNATNETGFRVDRCSGAACTNFAQIGTDLAVNATTFSDTGLTINTSYSYRVRAFNATDTSAWSAPATVVTGSPPSGSFTMVGAGEITTCASSAGPIGTAHIVDSLITGNPDAVAFTAGNNLADTGSSATFQNCFDPKWGSFKAQTYYALGNGDFSTTRGPDSVYAYFGNRTGPAHQGWFSFEKGNWHIIFLNTSTWEHGADSTYGITSSLQRVPSPQLDWLANDLSTNTKPCIMVVSWERRIYTTSTGTMGRNSNMLPITSMLHDYGVDLMVSAKDKLYARFAPLNPVDGTPDSTNGLRQFIVGTGGRTLDAEVSGAPPLREAYIRSWGVLKLTLNDTGYDWQFIPTTPGGQTDSGSAQCHQ